jgi:hypothetical protein
VGASYVHICDGCGYRVRTSGPWEFYRDDEGRVRDYGHPAPVSKEAIEAGIHGLMGRHYCPRCDKVSRVIVVEFVEPYRGRGSVWLEGAAVKPEYKREGAVKCPRCGAIELILEPAEEGGPPCPRCRGGTLVGTMEWIA